MINMKSWYNWHHQNKCHDNMFYHGVIKFVIIVMNMVKSHDSCDNLSWFIMTCHDISWWCQWLSCVIIMTSHDMSWHVMMCHDMSWFLKCSLQFSKILKKIEKVWKTSCPHRIDENFKGGIWKCPPYVDFSRKWGYVSLYNIKMQPRSLREVIIT